MAVNSSKNNNYKKKQYKKKKNNNKSFQNIVKENNLNKNYSQNLQDIINSNNIVKKSPNNTTNNKKKKPNNIPKKTLDTKKNIKIEQINNNNIEKNIKEPIIEEPLIIEKEDSVKVNNTVQNKELEIINDNKEELLVKNEEMAVKDNIPEEKNTQTIKEEINSQAVTNNTLKEKKNNKLLIIIILLLLIICSYLLIPKIKLNGNKNIIINYDEEYKEPGYKASFIFKDITKNIKVNNNVKNGNIGKYKIIYSYRIGFIIFKKTRIVNIVDNKPPEVLLDDEITMCPNDDISSLKYEIFDEYDGDITNKAISKYIDNKLIISASDNSNNKVTKEVIIRKEDAEKPIITLKGNETIYLNYGSAYSEPGYEAIDNCDGNITDKVNVSGKVNDAVGTYKITYTVSDSSNNKTEVIRTVIIRNNYLYNNGSISSGTIYLTFDDGPSNGTTNVILDVLKEEGVKATFFVTCNGPDSLIKRMYDEGHTVALHTASHNYSYVYSSVDNYFADLNRVSNRVKNITGIESKIIRFPGGSSNTISRNYKTGIMSELTRMVLDKGYRYFDWNVDSNDAGGARSSAEVYNNVIKNLSKSRSNVVLMHDIKYTTRDAIRNIIKYGKANGYNFEKIDMNTYMVRHGVNN